MPLMTTGAFVRAQFAPWAIFFLQPVPFMT
jgi:hypothetical protein